MDFFRNSFRGIFVFVVGLCMVCWPSAMVTLAVKVIGFCLIFAGLVTIVYNLANNGFSDLKGMSLVYLVSAVLLLAAGIILLVKTSFFVRFVGIIFGIILFLYGLVQVIHTINYSKGLRGRIWLYLVPVLICALGVAICFYPEENARMLCIIFGICLMFLGITEMVLVFKARELAKRLKTASERDAQDLRNAQPNGTVIDVEAEEIKDSE